MFRTFFKWLRPSSNERVLKIKERLALVYAVVGMHAFIYGFYSYVHKDLPSNTEERKVKIISSMVASGKNVEVMHLKGMHLEETSVPTVEGEYS